MESTSRIRHIDGCRAVAVLSVVLDHCVAHAAWAYRLLELPPSNVPMRWLVTLLAQGAHGVDLFFVISGFCLSYPTMVTLHREGRVRFSVQEFFSKRFVRIVPPYYVALLLCLAALIVFRCMHLPVPSAMASKIRPWDVIGQLLFWDRGTYFANGAFWTLFVECRWYLLFPLLLLLWLRSKRAYGVLLLLLIVLYNCTRARSIDVGVLPAFMLGIVAADWHVTEHPLRKHAPLLAFIAFAVAVLLEPFTSVPGVSGGEEYGAYTQANTGWHLCCFFFVLAVGSWAPLRWLLQMRPLVWIGAISYSIYLVHQPIVSFFAEDAVASIGPIAAFVLGFFVSIVTGALFWWLVERRFCHGNSLYARLVQIVCGRITVLLHQSGIPEKFILPTQVNI
jgi:peptidoglycan/LPS O-acetylase OafA/YrhL